MAKYNPAGPPPIHTILISQPPFPADYVGAELRDPDRGAGWLGEGAVTPTRSG
jgi:hypothetical protein